MGCNRGLQQFTPDAMVWSDRQPYWQQLGHIRSYGGVRIISRTIFNKDIEVRGEPVAPAFDGNHISIMITTAGEEFVPKFSFDSIFLSGPSIALIMLQLAVAAGYKRIGLMGIDFDYSKEQTHFWGRGEELGAFQPSDFAMHRIVKLLTLIREAALKTGARIHNLSPVRGRVDAIFPERFWESWLR